MKEKRWLSSDSVYLWTGEGQFKRSPPKRASYPIRLARYRRARNRMRFRLFEHSAQ